MEAFVVELASITTHTRFCTSFLPLSAILELIEWVSNRFDSYLHVAACRALGYQSCDHTDLEISSLLIS